MTSVNLPLGSTNSGTNDWSDVYNNDKAIADVVNGGLDNTNLSGSAGITDANLASPNNGAYRVLLFGSGSLSKAAVAGSYITGNGLRTSGTDVTSSPPPLLYFNSTDYTVGSKTQKLRLRAQVCTNATAPAITFTFGLYPITVAGGADALTMTLGTVVPSSTTAIASPPTSAITSGVTSDFTIPSNGAYALGVVTSATLATSSAVLLSAQLQTRSV